ncbi:MAG: hypothetical protein ACP5N1_05660 [Candidatus Woesearchaeota archaeon]
MASSDKSLMINLRTLYSEKIPPKSSKNILSAIYTQKKLISSLDSSAHKKFSFILFEIAKNFSKENLDLMDRIGKFDKTKQNILINSLESELQQIFDLLIKLKNNISEQQSFIKNAYNHSMFLQGYTKLLSEENVFLTQLEHLFSINSDLENKFLENISSVEKIKSKNWFIKLIKRF